MKFRLMSDLHIDVNDARKTWAPPTIADDIITLIPGDISGDTLETISWIKNYMKNTIFIEGNHICYNHRPYSIQYFYDEIQNAFKEDENNNIFLQDDYVILDDVVIIGSTLWTDLKYDQPDEVYAQFLANNSLNDYYYGIVNFTDIEKERQLKAINKIQLFKELKEVKHLEPKHTVEMFNTSLKFIESVCKQYPDKKILVMTHHAPSPLSIAEKFKMESNTHCYVSNLEDFILDNPNIKVWVHGHTHSNFDYMIGNCRVLCNPRGYKSYGEDKDFDPKFIFEI